MATGRQSDDFYTRVLECAGFYRNGCPIAKSVWSADELQSAVPPGDDCSFDRIDRRFKYQAVLQLESKNGRIGVSDIYELSQSPCIYFKRWDADPSAAELTKQLLAWQQTVWNDGRAPMLWVITPAHVRILNAYVRPNQARGEAELRQAEIQCFENIANGLDQLRKFASREQIQSGRFWGCDAAKLIDRRNRVDSQLIKDLGSAAEQLAAKGLELAESHRLLLRGVFATYLQARGWLSSSFLQKTFEAREFKDALTNQETARKMFDWLAETFNGDVFPHRAEIKYTADQLGELKLLLDGGDPNTRQRYLWPYEFGMIPVELLSAIYESFSHKIDPHIAKVGGVHYTPINLVELTLGEVFDDALFEDVLPMNAKVADLSCGSGVFLVQSLRRLVARRVAAGEKLTRDLIRNTLYDQIFGIDRLGGAVHIAAVSLYLAALELDPHPGVGNRIKFKPLIYPKNDKEKRKKRPFFNLYEADAFDPEADFNLQEPFAKKQLSVVVGNPPWTRPEGERSEKQQGKKTAIPLHVRYCQERDIQLPNQDTPDQAFLWRAADLTTVDARLGLILSGRRFFSHDKESVAAKRDLLLRFAPLVMMNLGELHREKIFPTAQHPAMIVVARNRRPKHGVDCTYATVERSKTFRGHGVLEIGPESIKPLSIFRAAQQEYFLKIASWGSARDAALISYLKHYPTLEKLFQQQGVDPKQGFTRGKEKNRIYSVPKENIKQPCLEEEGPIPFIPFGMSTVGLPPLKDEKMQRPRNEAIYRGPLFLFTLKLVETGLTSSICPAERLVYSQRYYGIPLPKDKSNDWAYCLNGIINSSLATYFIFLTAAEWGVERDNVNGADLMRLPMPEISSSQSPQVKRLLDVEEKLRTLALQRKAISKKWRRKLDKAVFDLYDLDPTQRILVEDLVTVTIDFQRNIDKAECLQTPKPEHLDEYARSFLAIINEFLGLRNERKATAEVFDLPGECPLRVVKFTIVSRSSRVSDVRVVARQEFGSLLERIAENLPVEIAADVYTRRNARYYGPGEVYLIKPAQIRFWTRSAGMNDADAVLAEHLRSIS